MDLQQEWNNLFSKKNYLHQLKNSCLLGSIGTENFRSVCWRIFWECLSENNSTWVDDATVQRKRYTEIRNKYVLNPYEKDNIDVGIHHPLSQAEDSVWHQYFQDNELRHIIMQDLDRLFPEMEFFQQDCVKTIILHILFCYARENAHVEYKQGMHEILAPLIYIMVSNSLAVKESVDVVSDDIKVVLDLNYVEHDAYSLFSNIMEHIVPWYTNLVPLQGNQTSAIYKKLTCIQCYMLKRYDSDLQEHLERLQVTPQLYGIRWIRLLFGREFSLSRLLILWDAIFAFGIDLVDFIFLAMLINLRGVLLISDFNGCLSHLMKYPPNTDTKYILKRAVSLKNIKRQNSSAETIPCTIANQMENNIYNINSEGKAVFYSQRNANSPPEHSLAPRSSSSSLDSSMRAQRTNSLGKQISHIKDRVGTTPQLISSLVKTKQNSAMNTLIEDHAHLQKQVMDLRTQIDKMSSISLYCGGKMDLYISVLQDCLLKTEACGELEVHAFAGLKQVRDVLKDGLESCGVVSEYEEDFKDIDEHIADASNKLIQDRSVDETINDAAAMSDTAFLVQFDPSDDPETLEEPDVLHVADCGCPGTTTPDLGLSEEGPVEVLFFNHEERKDENSTLQPEVACSDETSTLQTLLVCTDETSTLQSKVDCSGETSTLQSEVVYNDETQSLVTSLSCSVVVNLSLEQEQEQSGDPLSVDELNLEATSEAPPSHLDPLTAFQQDLASCDLSF